jgi:predicted RNA binding protein YcfA (HicA-like mRNA interferase family)
LKSAGIMRKYIRIERGAKMAKIYNSREIIKILQADGWVENRVSGSHHQFTHPTKRGIVTVPHPKKELKIGTVKSIFKQAGL